MMFKKLKSLFGSKQSGSPNRQPLDGKPKLQRATRVQLHPIHKLAFIFEEVISDKPVRLANISASGLGILREPDQKFPPQGTVLKGRVVFSDKQYEVTIKLIHVGPMVIGCQFEGDTSRLKSHIEEYLTAELAAMQLTQVNSSILKEEPDGEPMLFRGQDNCELFIVTKEGVLVRFQLSFFGNYIEGGRALPTKYGYMYGGDENDEPRPKATGLVRLVSGLPSEIMEAAIKFVLSIPELSPELAQAVCDAIRQGSRRA